MKYCSNCGGELNDNASYCPYCGKQVSADCLDEPTVLGILSLVFGMLGGFLGMVFGVIGLCVCKDPQTRKRCKIGIGLFFAWIVLSAILFVILWKLLFPIAFA